MVPEGDLPVQGNAYTATAPATVGADEFSCVSLRIYSGRLKMRMMLSQETCLLLWINSRREDEADVIIFGASFIINRFRRVFFRKNTLGL